MRTHDIKYQAYGPLSPLFRSPGGPVDAVVDRIAAERNATPAQVLLLWAAQQGGGTVVT
jgi:diketogulonate reductase-like aldo/keto reductase